MKNYNPFQLIIVFCLLGLMSLVLTNTYQKSYWKSRCLEVQDNYEAISKENEDLRDSIYILKDSIRTASHSQSIY